MSDKKVQDEVAGESEKDVAAETQIIESASPEQDSSQLEGSELESSPLESFEPDSADHLGVTADAISARLEQLLPGVLEIAEATNNAADVSRQSSTALKKGLDQVKSQADALTVASEKSARLASRILSGTVAALVVSVMLYSFIAMQLANRVTQVDSMLFAVSKRIVQMNSALTTFEQLRSSIEDLAVNQGQFSNRQML